LTEVRLVLASVCATLFFVYVYNFSRMWADAWNLIDFIVSHDSAYEQK